MFLIIFLSHQTPCLTLVLRLVLLSVFLLFLSGEHWLFRNQVVSDYAKLFSVNWNSRLSCSSAPGSFSQWVFVIYVRVYLWIVEAKLVTEAGFLSTDNIEKLFGC